MLSRNILLELQTFATGSGLLLPGFQAPHGYENQDLFVPEGHSLRGAGDVVA
jgi:hypothetical protein